MLTPQFLLPLAAEMVIDLFAGGGGASTGIEQAIGRPVDAAINHDPEAISLHQANHPQTVHYCSDVFEVDPLAVTQGRPVGLLWASPDCKHFSKAKGGKPVSKKIRSLAGVVLKWVKALKPFNRHPRIILLENVEEFATWGPLVKRKVLVLDAAGKPSEVTQEFPCPLRKGETFARWKRSLELLGYTVEHRELRACDFGAPTIRKRLFLVARRDGQPIVWPTPTHADPKVEDIRARKRGEKRLPAWRTAADCIDFSIPAPSIFERKKPLADATCRRIAKGIIRYVVNAAEPFIVNTANSKTTGRGPNTWPLAEPLRTVTSAPGFAVVSPTLVQTGYGEREGQAPRALDIGKPLGTLVGSQKHALVSAFLAHYHADKTANEVRASSMTDPVKTQTTENRHALLGINLIHMGHGEGKDGGKRFSHGIRNVADPLNTVTASGVTAAIVTSNLVKLRSGCVGSATDEPLHTVSAQSTHHAEVRAFLIKYYGTDQDPRLQEPMHTVPTKDRFGLVTVHGVDYVIVDIGLRMLTPRELYRAQGFPPDYRIDTGADGHPLTKTAQVRMCGNSVCPPLSRALTAANYFSDISLQREAA